MYKNGVEKFLVGNNVDITVLREENEKETHYVLMKISLFGKVTYALCALGDGYALEIIGEQDNEAYEFFELILQEAPEPCHIFDIITDHRRERQMRKF